jgi:CRP-like cAMP-binding protein
MPKALQFRGGSVIYFQGDAAEKIYILQAGKVSLNYTDIENGQDIHDLVQPGEFFGVKSAMGRYPREENALVLQDAAVVSFSVPEFEQMAMQNIRIVMKMLKVFSNQLRRVHKQVANLMKNEEQLSPEIGLYKTGEYYLKNKQYQQAKYVFSRYLTYYPAGKMAAQAAKYVDVAEGSASRYGDGHGPAPIADVAPAASAAKPPAASRELSPAAKAYYEAVSLFSQDKFPQALLAFKKIVDAAEDAEFVAKSYYEIGRCLFQSGKPDDCIKHFTQMITSYPKHPDLGDALYYMAQSYEKRGDAARAAAFYKKILAIAGDEDDTIHMKAKKALKALEA